MAKLKLKKGETGMVSAMIPRKKAIEKLGVTLRQFRRLCILKGVFPRPAPPGHAKLKNKTLFLRKDITFLAQDPIVATLREKLAFKKKKKRLITRREPEALRRLERGRPVMRLDHIIRERYPTFPDAVRGLDDALTLLGVVAAHTGGTVIATEKCRRAAQLLREFEHYVAEAHLLTKCFIARKGLYYQARVEGINVTWMIPHPFSLASAQVEYDVIRSFLELYFVLVQFVVYKLYQDRHMTYPPRLNAAKNADGEYLTAFLPDEGQRLVTVAPPAPAPGASKAAANDAVMKERIASLSKKLDKIAADDAREEAAEEAAAGRTPPRTRRSTRTTTRTMRMRMRRRSLMLLLMRRMPKRRRMRRTRKRRRKARPRQRRKEKGSRRKEEERKRKTRKEPRGSTSFFSAGATFL